MQEKPIAIYARTACSDNSNNIHIQTWDCMNYFLSGREKAPITFLVYMDIGVSGTIHNAPSLMNLKKDVMERKIDTIVVKDFSRLSRSLDILNELRDYFKKHGINIVTLQ